MRNPLKPLIISRISITLIITSVISEKQRYRFSIFTYHFDTDFYCGKSHI